MTIFPLQPLVPSSTCLTCDGCCRFKEPGTIWRPKLTEEETRTMARSTLSELILRPDARDEGQFIKTKPGCGEHLCQFFNPENHHCAIYTSRPFECELYPYVISRNEQGTSLYLHLSCPFVQDHQGGEKITVYDKYLRDFFRRPDVVSFLSRNREFLNDYSAYKDELQLVFVLEGI